MPSRNSRPTSKNDPLLLSPSKHNNSNRSIGWCSHLVICSLPVLGGIMILLVLAELLRSQGSITSFFELSISDALAVYQPYNTVLIPVFAGSTIMFIVTMARNIQIAVYFRRHASYSWLYRLANLVAAVVHIAAYVGFCILALFKTGGGGREEAIHYIGSVVYFSCSCVYGILHAIILFRQAHYPLLLRLVFVFVAAATVVATVIYGLIKRERVEYEWMAVVLAAAYVMMFAILFQIDQVDDEIAEFFCCRSSRQRRPVTTTRAPI